MALEIEQINEIVDKVKNALKETGVSPFSKVVKVPDYTPIYKECVELMNQIRIHAVKGVFPEELFALRSPNETDVEQKYRKDVYKQITLPVFMDYLNIQNRAFNDANWTVEYNEEKIEYKGDDFQTYVEKGIKQYGSLEWFIFNILTIKKGIDANGVFLVKPIDLVINENGALDSDALIEPQPFYVPSDRVIYFNEDYALIQSLEKSMVSYGSGMKKEGFVFELYDENTIYRIEQVGKFIEWTFEISVYFTHNMGKLPVMKLGGVPRLVEDELLYQSPFSFVTDNLDLAVLDSSNLAISKSRTAFPVPVSYGQICEFQNEDGFKCTDGVIRLANGDDVSCTSCNGSGLKTRLNPMTGILLKPATIADDGDKGMTQDPLRYVAPSSEILEFLDKQIDKHIERARQILHLPDADSSIQGKEGITATGSSNKLKALYSFVKPISDQIFELYEFGLNTIGKMRYGDNYGGVKVNRPVSFDFKTESDYLADINQAIESQMPPMVLHTILYRYLNTYYYNETKSAKVLNLLVSVDRLFGMTMEQITMKLARNLAAPYEDVLHNSGITLVQELIMEDDNFLNLELDIQMEKLVTKAKEKADTFKSTSLIDDIIA